MNDDLFCSICVDTTMPRDAMALQVAELTGGVIADGGVDCSWAHIAVDDEVMPPDHALRDEVVRGVASLMNALIGRGLRVLAKAEYTKDLPGGGEVAR